MDLVYSLYLAAVGQHWTIWANNVPDGIQTSILLVMLLRIEYVDHRKGLDGFGRAILPSSDERPPDETTPLTKPSARLNRQLDV